MLSEKEIEILAEAKMANPWWFDALMKAASIMRQRRKKYSGSRHALFNFADLSYRENRSLVSIFRSFLNVKLSRLGASGDQDFEDESSEDTFIDLANYSLMAAGTVRARLTAEDILPYSEWCAKLMEDEQVVSGQEID